ncbi:DUF1493 family protein [Mixta intestinalis]|uniref:DUF1493 family protein n=1 Tax=Mixta intestinalis TaxID=1615494 RepID=UPI003CC7028C
MCKANYVHTLLKKYFWEMTDDTSLSTGDRPVLPEEAADFLNEYAAALNVDMTHFHFNRYFPREGVPYRSCQMLFCPLLCAQSITHQSR